MAGTIPLSMSQQFDEFGEPLSGGLLYIYQAGTVATPQNAYQDYGLTILQPNPIPLDAAGRIPQFFLADGFIKVRLVDRFGVTQLSADFVLVIGPSSGGGGGGGVDPTTLVQTGMLLPYYGKLAPGVLAGFVRANGLTMGNAVSGATERANADVQALWTLLYQNDPNLVVSGGRTGNALNDFNAGKTIVIPDLRGRAIFFLDDMGNTPINRLTSTYFGADAKVLGAAGGGENFALLDTHIPILDSSNPNNGINITFNVADTSGRKMPALLAAADNVTFFNAPAGAGGNVPQGVFNSAWTNAVLQGNYNGTIPLSVQTTGTNGTPHRTVSPGIVMSAYFKL